MDEVLAALRPRPGGRYADGTIGGAGHAAAILAASSPDGLLFGCDRDGAAVEAANARLAEFAGRFEIRRGNYAELADWVTPQSCDGLLLDLGVSSPQLDQAERGFSILRDGNLDMRMDQRQPLTAAHLVNAAEESELSRIFWELGGERNSRRLARVIVQARERRPIETTRQLAELVERCVPRGGKRAHPATKVFQALRMAVNDEVGSLKAGLAGALKILRPGGILAVITFQGLDDRIVKDFARTGARDYSFEGEEDIPELRQPRKPDLKWEHRKAILPSETEMAANPRSRSAQLRIMERI